MLLSYETVFSRTRNKMYDPKELSLNNTDLNEIYTERLHSLIGDPNIRCIFSSITLDDEIHQIDFSLENSVDDFSDTEFTIEVLSLGMVIEWLKPQIDSILYTSLMIGGKEEKNITGNNYKNISTRLNELEKKLKQTISHYGYMHNSYIDGDS